MKTSSNSKALSRSLFAKFFITGVALIGANLRAPITSIGPVLRQIQTDLGLGDVSAGILNSLPLVIFAFLSLVAPSIGRKIGLERTLAGAVAAIAFGTVIRSIGFAGSLWVGTVILSVGVAFGNVLLPGLVKRDMPENAAGVIGLYAAAMAASAGLAAGLAVPISHLPHSSWRWAIGIWALLALLAMAAWMPILTSAAGNKLNPIAARNASHSPWRSPIGWYVSLFFAFHSLVFYSLVDWFAIYAETIDISASAAGLYLLVYQVVAVATNLLCSPLIKRLPDQSALGFACGALLVIAALGLYAAPSFALIWIISAGLGAGLSMTTSLTLFGLRTRDHHAAAALSGMGQFIGYIGAAVGPLLFGVLHSATHSWTPPFVMLVIAGALVTLFASLAGRDKFIE